MKTNFHESTIPTNEEKLELFSLSIIATCRSILNTSSPVTTLGNRIRKIDTYQPKSYLIRNRHTYTDFQVSQLKQLQKLRKKLNLPKLTNKEIREFFSKLK